MILYCNLCWNIPHIKCYYKEFMSHNELMKYIVLITFNCMDEIIKEQRLNQLAHGHTANKQWKWSLTQAVVFQNSHTNNHAALPPIEMSPEYKALTYTFSGTKEEVDTIFCPCFADRQTEVEQSYITLPQGRPFSRTSTLTTILSWEGQHSTDWSYLCPAGTRQGAVGRNEKQSSSLKNWALGVLRH